MKGPVTKPKVVIGLFIGTFIFPAACFKIRDSLFRKVLVKPSGRHSFFFRGGLKYAYVIDCTCRVLAAKTYAASLSIGIRLLIAKHQDVIYVSAYSIAVYVDPYLIGDILL